VKLRAVLPATPTEVYAALTEPARLRTWFSEHANPAGFWGRWTPQGDAPHQTVLLASPGERLQFQWLLDDDKTTVDIRLTPSGDQTELTLHQWPLPTLEELMSPPARRDGRHTMHTFWPLAIGNLASHLTGAAPLHCDFSPSRPLRIEVTLTIAAPADAVWQSLTDPARVERWWGYAPEIEPGVGGKVTFGAEGRISEWEPNRVFAYTEEGMTTRWELSESDGVTTLTFTQSGFTQDERDNAAQHEAGWMGGLLELRRMHELGDGWTPLTRELPE
jgi:uncharacterized protein YndB with AHSA1/START domain